MFHRLNTFSQLPAKAYTCPRCTGIFALLADKHDQPPRFCPHCGLAAVERGFVQPEMSAIRDACLAALDEHRKVCKKPDCKEPEGMVAWLAHCLGVRSLEWVRQELLRYDLNCPGCRACEERRAGK